MFYSETLLSKTGPLARVWLAANIERKLTKTNILQSNIETSVSAIVDQGQAPMALRLSGQLLLGVVRIYSRKARYLLDDCNEALLKIKMAFRPGNVDLPANHSHAVNPASLTLPDVLTELDLLAPLPDPSLLFSQPLDLDLGDPDITLDSQVLSGSIERHRAAHDEPFRLEEVDDLILDVYDGPDTSIEAPRDAPPARDISEEFRSTPKLLDDDGVFLDTAEEPEPTFLQSTIGDMPHVAVDDDVDMGGLDMEIPTAANEDGIEQSAVQPGRGRESLSPLSSIRSSVEREIEQDVQQNNLHNTSIFEPVEEDLSIHQPNKVKRRKVLHADTDTELRISDIRAQQNDRSGILKPASFLPKDPLLLALMTMQRNGDFVSSILGDGRSQGWAPELRGILSLEVIRRSSDRKRKRDSGVADLDEEEESVQDKIPQLEIDQEEELVEEAGVGLGDDTTLGGITAQEDEEILPLADDEEEVYPQGSDDEPLSPVPDNFDDTTVPLLHPSESGPVSLGTKHAVHLLRERFGSEAADSPSQRQKRSVLFQDMLPESSTSRVDATKMFFEVLVLATKDAIKVEQPSGVLGGPIRIRGKRGLWGSWAETQAGGEIASQPVPSTAPMATV